MKYSFINELKHYVDIENNKQIALAMDGIDIKPGNIVIADSEDLSFYTEEQFDKSFIMQKITRENELLILAIQKSKSIDLEETNISLIKEDGLYIANIIDDTIAYMYYDLEAVATVSKLVTENTKYFSDNPKPRLAEGELTYLCANDFSLFAEAFGIEPDLISIYDVSESKVPNMIEAIEIKKDAEKVRSKKR